MFDNIIAIIIVKNINLMRCFLNLVDIEHLIVTNILYEACWRNQ